jgi:hypothetical protein
MDSHGEIWLDNRVGSNYNRLRGEPGQACLFRFFLASLGSIPSSYKWGRPPLESGVLREKGLSDFSRLDCFRGTWVLVSMTCLGKRNSIWGRKGKGVKGTEDGQREFASEPDLRPSNVL